MGPFIAEKIAKNDVWTYLLQFTHAYIIVLLCAAAYMASYPMIGSIADRVIWYLFIEPSHSPLIAFVIPNKQIATWPGHPMNTSKAK